MRAYRCGMKKWWLGTTACLAGVSSFLFFVPAPVTAATSPTTKSPTTKSATTTAPPIRSAGATPPPQAAVLPAVPPTDPTVFASAGPYLAGVLTMKVPALSSGGTPTTAEVWYPVHPLSSRQIITETTYDLKSLLPAAQRKTLGTRPGTLQRTDAARGEKIAPGGPFPVVVFSHGFAGFPTQSAFLMTHLASWGFVVVAPDHTSRDLAAVMSGRLAFTGTADVDDLRAAVAALGKSSLRNDVDLNNLAAVGHSAGANAAVRWAANEPRVQGLVLLAGGVSGPLGRLPEPMRPTLYMSAANDKIISAQSIADAYRSSQSPKRLIALKDSGHMAFTDLCTLGSGPGGMIGDAERLGIAVPPLLKTLGRDGCSSPNVSAKKSWPIIRSSVVAELRAIFGSGTPGFGLDQDTLNTLAGQGAVAASFTIG